MHLLSFGFGMIVFVLIGVIVERFHKDSDDSDVSSYYPPCRFQQGPDPDDLMRL